MKKIKIKKVARGYIVMDKFLWWWVDSLLLYCTYDEAVDAAHRTFHDIDIIEEGNK